MWLAKIISFAKGTVKMVTKSKITKKVLGAAKGVFLKIGAGLSYITKNGLALVMKPKKGRKGRKLKKGELQKMRPLDIIIGGLGALSLGLPLKDLLFDNNTEIESFSGLADLTKKALEVVGESIVIDIDPDYVGEELTTNYIAYDAESNTGLLNNRFGWPTKIPSIDLEEMRFLLRIRSLLDETDHTLDKNKELEVLNQLSIFGDPIAKIITDLVIHRKDGQFLTAEARKLAYLVEVL